MKNFEYLELYSSLLESDLNWFLLRDSSSEIRLLIYFPHNYFLILVIYKVTTYKINVYLKTRPGRPKTVFKDFPYELVSIENLYVIVESTNFNSVIKFANRYRNKRKSSKNYTIVYEPFNKFIDLVVQSSDCTFPILECDLPSHE